MVSSAASGIPATPTGPIAFGFLLAAFGYQRLWPIMDAVMADGLAIFLAGTRRSSAAGAVS